MLFTVFLVLPASAARVSARKGERLPGELALLLEKGQDKAICILGGTAMVDRIPEDVFRRQWNGYVLEPQPPSRRLPWVACLGAAAVVGPGVPGGERACGCRAESRRRL